MKKLLLAVIVAMLAAAVFFLYSLATVELPGMEGPPSSQPGYADVAPFQSQPASEPSPASEPGADTEPTTDLSFLSEEQRDVFVRAQEAAIYLADPSNLCSQPGNRPGGEIERDGQNFLLIAGQDENYEDFHARMLDIFTESCLEQLRFDQRYCSLDGKLAALVGGVGGAIDYAECPDTYRPEHTDENTVAFTLIGHYIEQGEGESDTDFLTRRWRGEFDSTMEFSIRLANTENGWRVDEFHSPHYPYTF